MPIVSSDRQSHCLHGMVSQSVIIRPSEKEGTNTDRTPVPSLAVPALWLPSGGSPSHRHHAALSEARCCIQTDRQTVADLEARFSSSCLPVV
jgi:hypothetical protein